MQIRTWNGKKRHVIDKASDPLMFEKSLLLRFLFFTLSYKSVSVIVIHNKDDQ